MKPSWLADFGRLAIANIASNLMVPLAGLIDTAFLGHLADIRHLAGVALATVLFNFIYWSFGFLRMGTTGLIAQAVGRGDGAEQWRVGLRALMVALTLGLLILIVQTPLRLIGFAILQADVDVLDAGLAFYQGRIWGAPAVLMNYVLLGWFLGQGQGRRVLVLAVVGNGANVLLDYWMIVRLGWDSYGAGLATALSQYAMLLVGGLLLSRALPWAQIWQQRLSLWSRRAVARLFRLNRDIMVRTWALLVSFGLFTNLSGGMGTETLAVNTLLLQALMLVTYFLDGIAFATEAYAGQFHGQGKESELRALARVGSGLSVGLGMGVAIALITFPQAVFGLLTDHQTVLTQLNQYVFWLLPVFSFGAIAFMLDGYFLGLTSSIVLRNSTILATGLGFMPLALMAYVRESPSLLWLAMTCFMAVRAFTLVWAVPASLKSS
ncbi:mate efflux family protein [Leptolyngbya sp. Heron Island J]|uniref:MATE family efflux transporter n=1 Tax=Leptolyngbya sp. Heron Island J TaxID=1385935 RepID=UPI0003B93B84|nr:MATE family efflux transporter [Leptolyngbya sp. Heron Island J]ESA36079.1 mate efflux family protein [Leptolyngbya sp. Heron Island J]